MAQPREVPLLATANRHITLRQEFDRQLDALVAAGHPTLAGLSETAFRKLVRPLADRLEELPAAGGDRVPFVIVITEALVPAEKAVAAVTWNGRGGFTTMEPADLARFVPTLPAADPTPVPDAPTYLAVDVDTGPDTLNEPPEAVLPRITAAGRSPLTVAEGIALLAADPGVLRSRGCYSLAGSRCGDRRVPALWVSRNSPRLGWCWAGAPHTWLGTASCGARLGG